MATTTVRNQAAYTRYVFKPLGALGTAVVLAAFGLAITIHYPGGTPLAAFGALVILGTATWMFLSERYEWSLVVLMVYLGLADGYLKLSSGSSNVTVARDLLLYAIAAGAIARMAMKGETPRFPPLTGWVVAWVAVVVVQVVNPDNGSFSHSIQSIRPHAEWVPLFFLGYYVVRSKRRIRNFLLLLLALTAINGLVSLVQANLTTEQLSAWGPGYAEALSKEGGGEEVSTRNFVDKNGEEHNRPFGLGGDSGFGGILGLIAFPAALALLALSKRKGLLILAGVLAAGVILAVAVSASRTAVLGSAFAIFAFAGLTVTSRAGLRTVVALGLALLIGYVAIGVITSSAKEDSFERYESINSPGTAASTAIDYRKETISRIPTYFVKYPLGSGFGRNGPAASIPGGPGAGLDAESEPTYLLIELGIPGLVVLVGFFIALFRLCITKIRRLEDMEMRILLTGMAAPLFAIFAVGYVGTNSATVPMAPYIWFAAGVLAYWLKGPGYDEMVSSRSVEPLAAPPG